MIQLTRLIEKNISGKKVLGLFILTNVVYTCMLTTTIPRTMNHSNGLKLLDMKPAGYDLNYVRELFDSLSELGREIYLTNQIPLDMIYPLLFGLSYSLLLGYFLKKLKRLETPYIYLCLLPIIGGAADYIENIGIIIMLKSYPNLSSEMVNSVSFFSMVKSVSTSLYFITLMVVFILLGIRLIKTKNTTPQLSV